MNALPLLALYCVLIIGASVAGGWLPSLVRLTHTRMQLIISFVGGLMLGVAVLHLLPHGIAHTHSVDTGVWCMLVGLLGMFFLLRAFHFHHHGPLEPAEDDHDHTHAHDHAEGHHHHHHDHGHAHAVDVHEVGYPMKHRLSWIGVALGLALHTALDGVALAASVVADAEHDHGVALFGFSTFLAVLLHKPLDAMSITSLMAAGGWRPATRHFVNAMFATMCPLGALIFYFGFQALEAHDVFVGMALSFSAGIFLCIALGDLLPEVQFHSHDRINLSAALLLGVALAVGIGYLEPDHLHDHGSHGHGDHEHHDHGNDHELHSNHEH